MERARQWFLYLLSTAGALGGAAYVTYAIWKQELLEVWHTLQHLSVSDVSQAVIAGGIIGVVIYLLGKLSGWPHKNVYHWLMPWIKSLMRPIHRERLDHIQTALSEGTDEDDEDADEDDGEEDDEEEDYDDPVEVPAGAEKVHHWMNTINELSQQALGFVFWVVGSIAANNLLHTPHSSAVDLLARLAIVVVAVALLGIPLRLVAGLSLMALWLDYIAVTGGEQRSAVQAALIGVGLVLWTFWGRWREKIRADPPQES